jgi:DNA topoisomerase VI subunit B
MAQKTLDDIKTEDKIQKPQESSTKIAEQFVKENSSNEAKNGSSQPKQEKPEDNSIIANTLAKSQRDIGVAEFFARNRHLLGFDNKKKALMTAIKEAVDNSLDACEEAGILPEVMVEIIEMGNDRFRVIIEDNGPGIVKKQIPKIFAKLLYGSKFHTLKMSRGQQGIGISASVMYGQLTTGRPAKIVSKIDPKEPANYYELKIDTHKNSPEIVKEAILDWNEKEHGTRIEIDLEASYVGGSQSVDQYLKETAIVNPHVTIIYTNPKAQQIIYPRATDVMPKKTTAIKPHPYGVELGVLMDMLKTTESRTMQSFLTTEFSRVGAGTAKEICSNARIQTDAKPHSIGRELAEKLLEGIKQTRIMAPSTDCIAAIGKEQIEKGLKKEINAEFYTSTTRPPSVYRGNPFIIEAGIAYGGDQPGDQPINIMRFANRVPLLYQQGACVVTKAISATNWRAYGLSQSASSVPVGPCTVTIHIASVWVPFTSESKEAIAHYPEILKEIRLALQECGRELGSYLNKKRRINDELQKRGYIEKYIPHVSNALREIIGLAQSDEDKLNIILKELLEKTRGTVEDVDFDPEKNLEFDETLATRKRKDEDDSDDYEENSGKKSEDDEEQDNEDEDTEEDNNKNKGKKKKNIDYDDNED